MGWLAVDEGVRDEEFVGGGAAAASCRELKSDMAAPWIDMENLDMASGRFFQKPGINAFGQAFRFIPSQVAKTWDDHHSLVIPSTSSCIVGLFGPKQKLGIIAHVHTRLGSLLGHFKYMASYLEMEILHMTPTAGNYSIPVSNFLKCGVKFIPIIMLAYYNVCFQRLNRQRKKG